MSFLCEIGRKKKQCTETQYSSLKWLLPANCTYSFPSIVNYRVDMSLLVHAWYWAQQ